VALASSRRENHKVNQGTAEMKRIKWIFGLAAIVVTAFALAAGTKPSDKPASDVTVKIDNRSFDPGQRFHCYRGHGHLDEQRRYSPCRRQ
jgi:hypothetical protein